MVDQMDWSWDPSWEWDRVDHQRRLNHEVFESKEMDKSIEDRWPELKRLRMRWRRRSWDRFQKIWRPSSSFERQFLLKHWWMKDDDDDREERRTSSRVWRISTCERVLIKSKGKKKKNQKLKTVNVIWFNLESWWNSKSYRVFYRGWDRMDVMNLISKTKPDGE